MGHDRLALSFSKTFSPHFSWAFYCGGGSRHVYWLRSVELLDVLSSMPGELSVARFVSMPICAASLQNSVTNAS